MSLTLEQTQAGLTQTAGQRRVWVIFSGLMLALLIASLDQTIVSTALPTMVSNLGGLSQLSWVVTGYLLSSTVSTPLWGKLGDLYGRKRLFQASILVFLLGGAQQLPIVGTLPQATCDGEHAKRLPVHLSSYIVFKSQPPSAAISAPTTNEESSEARNSATLATSSGRPRRLTGERLMRATSCASRIACDVPERARSRVAVGPIVMVFTRTPRPMSSAARARASA